MVGFTTQLHDLSNLNFFSSSKNGHLRGQGIKDTQMFNILQKWVFSAE